MASLNKCLIIGHLGKDPETSYMPSGDAVCEITVATSESWTDKNSGEKREAVEWHRVKFFRKLAEIAGQYLTKGSQVYIEGKITTSKWKDKKGNDRYTTEIIADTMKMLGGKNGAAQAGGGKQAGDSSQAQKSGGGAADEFPDDEVPFATCAPAADMICRKHARRMSRSRA